MVSKHSIIIFDISPAAASGEGLIQRNLDPRQQVPAGAIALIPSSGVQVHHHGLLAVFALLGSVISSLRNGPSLTSSLPHVQLCSMTITRDPAHGREQTVAKLAGTQITETISNATSNHAIACLADNDISSRYFPQLTPNGSYACTHNHRGISLSLK
ncbi:hypothetical protein CY34DRAFT_800784 [Suillus luteus UH-Slu-Lm8-n1]|uniref:Uncharacterized protein n=1 Tax=Suillus luteus UH-Slu-Lm8-n1 TaxID=930992 RepID=A0A0D0BJJ6_9AGAM|nr:hypothetical protein CY34DRAFT_800784 [Suillus luteus UH-Slu-Lm8-n1]